MKEIRSLISVNDLSKEEILGLLQAAAQIEQSPQAYIDKAKGKVFSLLFFEPSTRTYFSFASAMERLGGSVLGFSQAGATSVAKGETLEDTVRMMAAYSDIMAVRHAEVGTLQRIVNVVEVPVINAGEGVAEHPTQTLVDLYTIFKNFKRLDVTIALYGDLKYSRPNHSLLLAGSRLGINFICVAPEELQMPEQYLEQAQKNGAHIKLTDDINSVINNIDVLYVTRLQKERLPPHLLYEELKKSYHVAPQLVKQMKESAIILHPLPRIGEIDTLVDHDPRAQYFAQAKNSVAVRMALLLFLLKN